MISGDGSKITLADVAARCRVSVSAVSLALHREPERCKLATATRERIIDAARELGYRPNWAGRALQAQRSGLIGALHRSPRDALNLFSSKLLGELAAALHDDERDLVLVPVDERGGWRRRLLDRRLDAAVVLGDLEPDDLDELDPRTLPLVFLNAPGAGDGGRDLITVGFDDARAVHEICDHLLARGCQRIAWIGMEASIHGSREVRERAYRDWCGAHGRQTLVIERDALVALLVADAPTAPDGVACFSDDISMSLMRDCAQRGIPLPQRLLITGINDLESTGHAIPSLSTIRLPVERAAQRAAEAIDALLAGKRPRSTTLRGELVIRDSTGGDACRS